MEGYTHNVSNNHQGYRPLPSPAGSSQPLQGRRSLPKPPTTSAREDLPPSRSGRALPPVPGLAPSGDSAARRALPASPHSLEMPIQKSSSQMTNGRQSSNPALLSSASHTDPVQASSYHDWPDEPWTRPDIHVEHDHIDSHRYGHDRPTTPIAPYQKQDEVADGRGTPTQTSWLQDAQDRMGADPQHLARGLDSQPFSGSLAPAHSPGFNSSPAPVPLRHEATSLHRDSLASSRSSVTDGLENGERYSFLDAHPHRHASTRSSLRPSVTSNSRPSTELSPSWGDQPHAPSAWVERKLQIHQSHRNEMYDDESVFRPDSQYDDEDEWDEEEEVEVDESQFFNRALLSEMALQVKDKVNKGRHTKAGIAWVGSFTGRDIVVR